MPTPVLPQSGAMPRTACFALLVVATVPAFAAPLATLSRLALQQEHYSHIILIPAISAFLLLRDREKVFAHMETGWREGSAVLVAGLLVTLAGYHAPVAIS